MADPKDTEEQRRAARIKRTEEAVEKTKKSPSLTPEEEAKVVKLAKEMDENKLHFHRSLLEPKPPGSGGKGR